MKNPPIWMVASRVSKKQGEMAQAVYISEQKHFELVECCINWYEKTCAIIIYKAVKPIFYQGDALIIDTDFQRSAEYIKKYVKILLEVDYPRNPYMANPNILFLPDRNPTVKDAHIKSQRLHWKEFPLCPREKDPSFERELKILKKR